MACRRGVGWTGAYTCTSRRHAPLFNCSKLEKSRARIPGTRAATRNKELSAGIYTESSEAEDTPPSQHCGEFGEGSCTTNNEIQHSILELNANQDRQNGHIHDSVQ